jgi:hypothetical protein
MVPGACKTPPQQAIPAESTSSTGTSSGTGASIPAPAPTREPNPTPPPSALGSAVASAAPSDAGADARTASGPGCRPLRGPIELPLRTPAALALRGDALDVVLNDDGKPRTVAFPVPAPASSAVAAREPAEGGARAGYPVPCVVAGERVFCPDRTGAVRRSSRDGSDDRVVASSRTASHIAAASLGGTHAALAYLASRQTTEGWVSESWLAVDDEAPLRLSEDGAGATFVTLVPHGPAAMALQLDARAALSAMHVRAVTFEGKAHLGEDVVVFVGGPGDRKMSATLGVPPSGPAWALLPIAKDMTTFGVAAVRVDDPPRVDEPVVWSTYPNGLDPAPIAAAVAAGQTWVARVRPVGPEPGAARTIELGVLQADGTFVPGGALPAGAKPADVSLVVDAHGMAWVAWTDADGSWLERVACK